MTITFTTWTGTEGSAEPRTITKPALTGHQVYVKTTHAGLCGTDLHYRHAGIGLGHEGAGVIVEVGPEVTNYQVGDRVAWGWVCTSIPLAADDSILTRNRLMGPVENVHNVWRASSPFARG
jgi:D-arabinose 1-dehydrogenase-like Zn-dependent alcohol dehydrogenase